jgi:hypothetical protein
MTVRSHRHNRAISVSARSLATLGLTGIALACQLVGLEAQGSRGTFFGYLIPFVCAFLVGALNYLDLWVVFFVVVVGVGGPPLVEAIGYEEPTPDAYINLGMVWFLLAPALLLFSNLGLLFRLGLDAWRDRPQRARSS